jgi:hypothetical protein
MSLARHIYRLAILLYPAAFRRRYGHEMTRVFVEGFRDARRSGRKSGAYYCVRIGRDLMASAVREQLSALSPSSSLLAPAAVLCGCYAAYVDFHTSEVQATLLILLVSNLVLGICKPRGASWRAVVVAVFLPGIHLIVFAAHAHQTSHGHPYVSRLMMLLPALAASLAGAYAGIFLRYVCRKLRS